MSLRNPLSTRHQFRPAYGVGLLRSLPGASDLSVCRRLACRRLACRRLACRRLACRRLAALGCRPPGSHHCAQRLDRRRVGQRRAARPARGQRAQEQVASPHPRLGAAVPLGRLQEVLGVRDEPLAGERQRRPLLRQRGPQGLGEPVEGGHPLDECVQPPGQRLGSVGLLPLDGLAAKPRVLPDSRAIRFASARSLGHDGRCGAIPKPTPA